MPPKQHRDGLMSAEGRYTSASGVHVRERARYPHLEASSSGAMAPPSPARAAAGTRAANGQEAPGLAVLGRCALRCGGWRTAAAAPNRARSRRCVDHNKLGREPMRRSNRRAGPRTRL